MVKAMKGWQTKVEIIVSGSPVGEATLTLSHVSADIKSEKIPYYEIENPNVKMIKQGLQKITGTLSGAWINTKKLELLGVLTKPFSWTNNITFDLKITSADLKDAPILELKTCRFIKATITIPQDGFLEEDYDFIALEAVTDTVKKYTLIITKEGGGTTDPVVGSHDYDPGTDASVDAFPASGWFFDHWILDGTPAGSIKPILVTMNSDHSLQAVFREIPDFLSTHCPNQEITNSSSLVEDPSAVLTFTLAEEMIAFITYSACNYDGVSSSAVGKKLGIEVDTSDVASIESSPASSSRANGAFVFWIGELGIGPHTIKGKFASLSGTVRISERRLLICFFKPAEVSYFFNRSTVQTSYVQPQPPDVIAETCDPMPCAESDHPYLPDEDKTWTIAKIGAQCIRVHFTKVEIENGYDHLYLKDGSDNVIKDYTGYDALDFWGSWVLGDTIKLQLTSDGSVEYYGFYVDKIEYSNTGIPEEINEDPQANFEFNLSETKKALILYSACNYYNSSESGYGKKIGIKVNDIDGTLLGSSPYYTDYPDSEFVAEIHSLNPGDHVIKGIFAPNHEEPVTISERQFGILLFDPAIVLTNYIDSSVQVSHTGNVLTDDTEAIINRTINETRCVLGIYSVGKRNGTESYYKGKKVAIEINEIDYTLNAQSTYDDDYANTIAIQSDVVKLEAGEYNIKGRFASNVTGSIAKIDDRKLCVLWFPDGIIIRKRILIIQKQCEGTLNPAEGTYVYYKTENVSVLASPGGGWIFDHWELDGIDVGSTNPYIVQTDDKHVLKAFFTATGISTVQEFGGGRPIGYSSQRKVFYKDGYYYLFHQDTNGEQIYKVSNDKENWIEPGTGNPVATAAETNSNGRGLEVEWFGDNKVYVVVTRAPPFGSSGYAHVKIKEGTISSGTITWGSWTTIILKTFSSSWNWSQFGVPSLCKNADGYFWLVFKVLWENSTHHTWCSRSTNPNDITAWGISSFTNNMPWWCQNVPLTSGEGCYQMDKRSNGIVYGRTAKDWLTVGPFQQVTVFDTWDYPCALSTLNGEIHILYIRNSGGTPYELRYRKRSIAGTWGTEVVLVPSGSSLGSCALSYIDGSLYAIYRDGCEIYYRKYDGVWQDAVKISCSECGYTTSLSTTRNLSTIIGFMTMWAKSENNQIRVACN